MSWSWDGYERQIASVMALRRELMGIYELIDGRLYPPPDWLANSYIIAGRLDNAKELLKNLQWALNTAIYDKEPEGESDE